MEEFEAKRDELMETEKELYVCLQGQIILFNHSMDYRRRRKEMRDVTDKIKNKEQPSSPNLKGRRRRMAIQNNYEIR